MSSPFPDTTDPRVWADFLAAEICTLLSEGVAPTEQAFHDHLRHFLAHYFDAVDEDAFERGYDQGQADVDDLAGPW